jgi:hypothetical protein
LISNKVGEVGRLSHRAPLVRLLRMGGHGAVVSSSERIRVTLLV